jgi:hypothetical protein
MQMINNVPIELKELPQWAHVTASKSPLDVITGGSLFGWNNITSLFTFDDALSFNDHPRCAGNLFTLFPENNLILIDLDDPERIYDKAVKRNDPDAAKYREQARLMHREIQTAFQHAYWERSQSGKGWHCIMRGNLPEGATRVTKGANLYGVEIYASGQYFWATGNVPKPTYQLNGHQEELEGLVKHLWQLFGRNAVRTGGAELDDLDDGVRRLDLSDEDVVGRLKNFGKQIASAYDGGQGFRGDWSMDTIALLGTIDKITGDVEQARRVLLQSPRLRNAGSSNSGEDRYARTERRFYVELARCRADAAQIDYINRKRERDKVAASMEHVKWGT